MSHTPTTWNDLVGHEWAVDLLSRSLHYDRIGHAYLITGPAHIGKTTLSRLFAQALNCEAPAPGDRPCGNCRPCRLIAVDRHPDVRLVTPEVSSRGKQTLKIETVRELQRDLSLAAYEARYRVVLLVDFDAATPGAANAFLKTLEEPPARVVLLLTASEADALLPTIASRCRLFALRPLPAARIASALESQWGLDAAEARRLSHLADGRMGWAVQALQEPALVEARSEKIAHLEAALAGNRVERFALADRLAKRAETLPDLLQTWTTWWRDLALLAWQEGAGASVTNVDQTDTLRRLARQWEREQILSSLRQTQEAIWQLAHNGNTRLVLEHLFLTYPYAPAPR
ncbi:MAG: DNA polymerase III subunit delta' [Candidatus Promineifilaceae bacterium]|nr:DNA polymerase III subunit delta' [Candidatus Promineifilaceae bacterium]